MENLRKTYRDLEMRVMNELRKLVTDSSHDSVHVQSKCIDIQCGDHDYDELVIVNDRLTLLDEDGLHYDISIIPIDDVIDIIDAEKEFPELDENEN